MLQQLIDLVNALTERLNNIENNSKNITNLDAASLPLTPTDEIGFWDIALGKMVKTTLSELLQGGSSFSDALFQIFNADVPTKVVIFNAENLNPSSQIEVKFQNIGGTLAYLADIPAASHYKPPLQGLVNLSAILKENIEDKERRYVEDEYSDYFYDAEATSGDVAPTNQVGGVGWWVKAYTGVGNVGDMTKAEFMEVAGQVKDSLRLNGEEASFYVTAFDFAALQTTVNAHALAIADNSTAILGKEDALGNPLADGYILSSTNAGARTWIPNTSAGSGITFIEAFTATAGQTQHTLANAMVNDGKWTIQVGSALWNATNGVTGFAGALTTINFATGVITFNMALQAGTQVIIKHN